MEDMLYLITLEEDQEDLIKGKGNRNGLIQQVVTYVRDGRTVTRKQWVRSEFAEHAKKNAEQKRKTLLKEEEREDKHRQRLILENNEKKHNADKAQYKKLKARHEEETGHHGKTHKVTDAQLEEYKRKLKQKSKKAKKEEKERRESQNKKDKKETKKEARSRYGQADQTKAENKAEQAMLHIK